MSVNNQYITPQAVSKIYGVSSTTLRNWAESGKIQFIRPNGGRRLYLKTDVDLVFQQNKDNNTDPSLVTPIVKQRILYARVSSTHQSEDLQRQITFLQSQYPNDTLIQDIGSGLNWKRKGLGQLLNQVFEGSVSEIVVAYKDRLCRFGFELIELICQQHQTIITILQPVAQTDDRTQELAEDLLSIVTVFVAKNNGLRASKNRQNRNILATNSTTQ